MLIEVYRKVKQGAVQSGPNTYRASGAGYGCVRILRLDFLFSKCLKLLYFGTLLQNFIWQTFSIGSEGVIFVKICSSKDSWGQRRGPDSYPFGSTCLFSVHTHLVFVTFLGRKNNESPVGHPTVERKSGWGSFWSGRDGPRRSPGSRGAVRPRVTPDFAEDHLSQVKTERCRTFLRQEDVEKVTSCFLT